MPCGFYGSAVDRDPRRWEACRRAVAADMIAAGWHPKAGKFGEVQTRKARKLFAKGGA